MKFKIKNATKEIIDSICNDYTTGGLSLRKIASNYGCSNPTIMKVLKNNGIKLRDKVVAADIFRDKVLDSTKSSHKDICEMYENGDCVDSIARNFDMSKLTITTILLKNGINLRCNKRVAFTGIISEFESKENSVDYSISDKLYESISAMDKYTKCSDCGIVRDKALKVCTICFYKSMKNNKINKE